MYKAMAIEEMKKVFKDAPFGVDHTLKVLNYAEQIMLAENVSQDMRELILSDTVGSRFITQP